MPFLCVEKLQPILQIEVYKMKIITICLKTICLLIMCAVLCIFMIWLLNYKMNCGHIGIFISTFLPAFIGSFLGFKYIV